MTARISDAAQNAAVNAVTALIDAGASAGTLKIYTGSAPGDADTAPTGTLLVTVTLNDPAYAAASGGVAALDVTPALSGGAVATATAGYFLIEDSNGVNIMTGSITATGGGGDLELTDITLTSGQTVNITSLNVSIPSE